MYHLYMSLNKIIAPTFYPSKRVIVLVRRMVIMRRASEASLFFVGFPRKKKPLHNGSYEHRVPKKIYMYIYIYYSVQGMFVCLCDSTS